jgi:hypothetical protein
MGAFTLFNIFARFITGAAEAVGIIAAVSTARKMTTRRTLADLEISQTDDELVIRGRRMAVVVSLCFALGFVALALAIAYQNVVGTADVPPLRNRPDQVPTVVFIAFVLFAFGLTPIVIFGAFLRKRHRPWVFHRALGELTRGDQHWPLAGLVEVAVDVKRGRTRYSKQSAGVVLHFRATEILELARYHAGGSPKGYRLENRIAVAESLANIIGEFLELPVRHGLPANPGFEVVTSLRS